MNKSFLSDPFEEGSPAHKRFECCIKALQDPFLKFITVENVEMEARLGYMYDEGFETCVGQDFHSLISIAVATGEEWEEVSVSETIDKFADGCRLTEDEDGGLSCIKKEKLLTKDFTFASSPFDVRISFAREKPIDPESFQYDRVVYEKRKKRTSYVYVSKDTGVKYHFDLTHVTFSDKGLDKNQYQVEIELEGVTSEIVAQFGAKYILHSWFLKINDLVDMVEKIPKEASFEEI